MFVVQGGKYETDNFNSYIFNEFRCLVNAQNSGKTYNIAEQDILSRLDADKSNLDAFTAELEGFKQRGLTEKDIRTITARQDELNTRIRSYYVLYDYIPEISDDFRREHNQSILINGQNSGRIRDLINTAPGSSSGNKVSSWLISLIKPMLIAQFPYLETVINLLLN